jgi:hypothetical protein
MTCLRIQSALFRAREILTINLMQTGHESIICLPIHVDNRVHKTGTMPPKFESSEQPSQLPVLAEATASSTKYSLASRASPSLFTIPNLVNLEKDVFLLPILQPCHPRLSQGVSSLLLKAHRLLPLLPRCHQPSHDPISHVLRINKNIQLTKLITAPPKILSPPTLPLRTHLLLLLPNSRSSLPPASRPTPPIQRLLIHTITSP